jgi:catalase
VPGIDFTDDPLMAGRIHSYVDTQLTRLGGPNFHEIPINASVVGVHNNQREGFHRQAINRGRVNYEPNSLGGGCPFQAGMRGFMPTADPVQMRGEPGDERKVRGKSERFAEHYAQATLFWNSQSPVEQAHIVRAFRFELTRVQTPAVRERVLAMLANVARPLAEGVAAGLGTAVPPPLPKALPDPPRPEVTASPALSLLARPGDGNIQTRRVALLVADGVDGAAARAIYTALDGAGAAPRLVGPQLGTVTASDGETLEVDVTIEAQPSALFDAVVLLGGSEALLQIGPALEFVRDAYRHCKPILSVAADRLLQAIVPPSLPAGEPDPGIIRADAADDDALAAFQAAIARHRAFERYSDPPRV